VFDAPRAFNDLPRLDLRRGMGNILGNPAARAPHVLDSGVRFKQACGPRLFQQLDGASGVPLGSPISLGLVQLGFSTNCERTQ
jgi:hypothetical protein